MEMKANGSWGNCEITIVIFLIAHPYMVRRGK